MMLELHTENCLILRLKRRANSSSASSLPINTVMNANLEGVHAPLMQLGSVDEEYSLALDIAFWRTLIAYCCG